MSGPRLKGKRIVVTRAAGRAGELSAALRSAGADVVEMAATRIERLDPSRIEGAIDRLREYAWVIFTSRTAVEVFWESLAASGRDQGALRELKVAAVGPATASALMERSVEVHESPSRFVAEGLLEALRERTDVRGARVLYPVAEGARDVLPRGLEALGAVVDVIPIYRSVPDGTGGTEVRSSLERGEIDLVTFTAASAVKGFAIAVTPELARRAPAATIGPATTSAARELGIDVVVEARDSTIAGLVQSILDWAG